MNFQERTVKTSHIKHLIVISALRMKQNEGISLEKCWHDFSASAAVLHFITEDIYTILTLSFKLFHLRGYN